MKRLWIWFFILLCLCVASAQAQNYGEVVPSSDVVGLWHLNGDADDSAGSNNGSVTGAILTSFGKFEQAYEFDGDDYITISDDTTLKPASVTFAIWFKLPTLGQNNLTYLMSKQRASAGTSYGAFIDEVGETILVLQYIVGSQRTLEWDASGFLTADIWYHLVGVIDPTVPAHVLYVNGVERASASEIGAIVYNTDDLFIGSKKAASGMFTGIIDEVTIWDRALTSEAVKTLYAMQKGAYGVID